MFCINCFHRSTNVTNSRPHKKQPSIWRRRRCTNCQAVFTTYERPSLADNKQVQLASGESDTFNLGRLVISINKAFHHDPLQARYNALWLAQGVEDTLSTQYTTITPETIAAVTHAALKRFDELAAIQYGAQHQLITAARRAGRPSLSEPEPPIGG